MNHLGAKYRNGSLFHFAALDTASHGLVGIAISLARVNPRVGKKRFQFVQILVGIGAPQLVGSRIGMI